MPTVELPPLTPFTSHVTELLDAFCRVALNCCWPPADKTEEVGSMVTITGLSVTKALADFVVSAAETASTVTTVWLGIFDGAL